MVWAAMRVNLKITEFLFLAPLLASCSQLTSPVQVVQIPVALPGIDARWEFWADNLDDGRYVLSVSNHYGKLTLPMWHEWGPAQRIKIYLTPDKELYVYGLGGDAFVGFSRKSKPYLIQPSGETARKLDTVSWRYLGAIDGVKKLAFYPPQAKAECKLAMSQASVLMQAVWRRNAPSCVR